MMSVLFTRIDAKRTHFCSACVYLVAKRENVRNYNRDVMLMTERE